jgi:hypothetical protein
MPTIKEGGSFETFNDPRGNPLIAINRDGTVSVVGVDFADGTVQTSASMPGTGTVTNIVTGTGLTGGPITTTGTVALANTAPGAPNPLLTITPYVTAGQVHFIQSNPTSATQTPVASTINWRVVR